MLKKHKRYMICLLAAVLVLAAAAGIAVKGGMLKEKKFSVIYIPKIIDENNDFWKLLLEGVRMSAEEQGMELTIVAPETEDDYERQNELILWAIEQKPDAILLTPSHYSKTTPAVRKVKEAGIPVILIDSMIDEDIADAVIATNNELAGALVGEYMSNFVREDSQIAIVGHVRGTSTAIEREQGVRTGLGEYEEKIVDVVFCDSDYDKAYALMLELLETYPDINLVAGLNEYSSVGAARAIKDRNLQEQIKFVGIDSSLEEIQMLEAGIFEGIVIQSPFKMGYLGIEVTAKLLNGEKIIRNVDSGSELITRENVYTEENQKLLFPFKEE